MRKALILLAVVALLILVVGALNNGTAFDVDYVAGTVTSVSLLWVSAVLAALVFVVGLAAAWFAQAAMTGSRRKLEAELQSTYERLREAEALAARPAPASEAPVAEVVAATVVAEPEPATSWRPWRSPRCPEKTSPSSTARPSQWSTATRRRRPQQTRRRPLEMPRTSRPPSRPRSPWPAPPADEAPAEPEAGESAEAGRGGRCRPAQHRPPERDPAASVTSGRYTRIVMHS